MDRPRDLQDCEFRLLNDFQRGFPLVHAPFAAMGKQLGCTEADVLDGLRRLKAAGSVSRVGAVFAPLRVGASTLAALAAPAARLAAVADQVSRYPQVNHNYEREHAFNLWFVVTAPDRVALQTTLDGIARETTCPVISLPLAEQFHIDLGFDLRSHARTTAIEPLPRTGSSPPRALHLLEQRLLAALEGGLDLVPHPFSRVAQTVGVEETEVLGLLKGWLDEGIVRRFGVVVRHHELGYRANAMAVWDVLDPLVSEVGRRLAEEPGVNLCYRRERALPHWRYNLFCMIHGRERAEVEARIAAINRELGLEAFPHTVLFSTRRHKQCGARYAAIPAHG